MSDLHNIEQAGKAPADSVEFLCIVCPSSCRVRVTGDGKTIASIEGNKCARGKDYAINEYLAPKRMISSTVRAVNYVSEVIAVRTDKPVPKELIFECMDVIRGIVVKPPFVIGRVVIENILNTGCNIILCNN